MVRKEPESLPLARRAPALSWPPQLARAGRTALGCKWAAGLQLPVCSERPAEEARFLLLAARRPTSDSAPLEARFQAARAQFAARCPLVAVLDARCSCCLSMLDARCSPFGQRASNERQGQRATLSWAGAPPSERAEKKAAGRQTGALRPLWAGARGGKWAARDSPTTADSWRREWQTFGAPSESGAELVAALPFWALLEVAFGARKLQGPKAAGWRRARWAGRHTVSGSSAKGAHFAGAQPALSLRSVCAQCALSVRSLCSVTVLATFATFAMFTVLTVLTVCNCADCARPHWNLCSLSLTLADSNTHSNAKFHARRSLGPPPLGGAQSIGLIARKQSICLRNHTAEPKLYTLPSTLYPLQSTLKLPPVRPAGQIHLARSRFPHAGRPTRAGKLRPRPLLSALCELLSALRKLPSRQAHLCRRAAGRSRRKKAAQYWTYKAPLGRPLPGNWQLASASCELQAASCEPQAAP